MVLPIRKEDGEHYVCKTHGPIERVLQLEITPFSGLAKLYCPHCINSTLSAISSHPVVMGDEDFKKYVVEYNEQQKKNLELQKEEEEEEKLKLQKEEVNDADQNTVDKSK